MRRRAWRQLTLLAILAMVSPRVTEANTVGPTAATSSEISAEGWLQQRIKELQAREEELASDMGDSVEAQVAQRAAELDVDAPVAELAELLYRKAWLELDRDKCALRLLEAAVCRASSLELVALEATFERMAGLSATAFRRGRRDQLTPNSLPSKGLELPPGGSTRTDPEYCVCNVSIANQDRWINRHWGLECFGHGGHGVCSNDVDTWHSSGSGAMTGMIWAFYGQTFRSMECQDDHRTCFKGPKPSKPGGGQWGNVCNCDSGHSQFSDPFASWYGGDLTDAVRVDQVSFGGMVKDGPCGSYLRVQEDVEEHDPVCCDDAMGSLVADFWLGEEVTNAAMPVSIQNCNGGSQSGQPPNCGTFGATIVVQATCETRTDDPFGSCYSRCGELLPDATCNCDFNCQQYGDCCFDYCDACAAPPGNFPFPCGVDDF